MELLDDVEKLNKRISALEHVVASAEQVVADAAIGRAVRNLDITMMLYHVEDGRWIIVSQHGGVHGCGSTIEEVLKCLG